MPLRRGDASASSLEDAASATQATDGASTEPNFPPRQIISKDIVSEGDDATANLPPTSSQAEPQDEPQKPSGASIALIMVPLCLSVFMSALDLTIVTPAIPAIVSSFKSGTGYVWIGSAFILASTAITPVWGSISDIWGRKPIVLIALTIFLAGSLICALAHRTDMLIAGRAIQGLGSSGLGIMVNVIICDTFSLRDRGLYLAITSLVWAVGSTVGPIIGGSFVTQLRLILCNQEVSRSC